jgi:sigma-E factor negative regulatory protein RseC
MYIEINICFIFLALKRQYMKDDRTTIEHKGTVVSIDGRRAVVEITSESACSGCHARSLCSASDSKRKVIDVRLGDGETLSVGEEVMVVGFRSYGIWAVILAYLIPVILIVVTLIVSNKYDFEDGVAGLLSLGILIPYYLLLYMMRRVLYNKFIFKTKNQII